MAENYRRPISVWASLARGALGGFLGVFILFGYAVYENPYGIAYVGASLPFLWIAIISGLLVGAIVWLFGRFRGTNLGLLLRVVMGVAVSFIVFSPYTYLTEQPGDIERWWYYSVVFGLSVGGLAGIITNTRKSCPTGE